MNIMACASWRNYCCSCESFGGDAATLAQLCREKWAPNNFLEFQSFYPRPNSPHVFAAPLPKLSSRKRSRRLRRLWLLQIAEVQWSQDNAMFSVFSHYVGCCVERIWQATVLRTVALVDPNQGPQGCRGAQLFRFSERAPPPPPLPIFTSRSGFPAISCKPVLASSWYDLSNPPLLRALYFCGLKHSLARYLSAVSVRSNFSHWEF